MAEVPEQPIEGSFAGCFGCGDDNRIGLQLRFSKQADRVVARTVLDKGYAGYRQFAHGGVVATMLDEAMGWALLHQLGRWGVTRDLRVTYRRPVRIGVALVLSGRPLESVDASEPGTVRLEARIEDERGRLLASADGRWTLIRERSDG